MIIHRSHPRMIFTGGHRRPYLGHGPGCGGTTVLLVLAVVVAVFIFGSLTGNPSSEIGKSTVQREPLPAGTVQETGYYTDTIGWITDQNALTSGMKDFYRRTGVQPYLYLLDNIDGNDSPSVTQLSSFAEDQYDTLFSDEGHFLLVFWEHNNNWAVGYHMGSTVSSVMDDEALGILEDYFNRYYYSDLDEEEFFSTVFEKTGERIMSVTRSPWPTVLLVLGIAAGVTALIFLGYSWWKKAKEKKQKELELTKQILETPLETFGDQEAEDRAKKYDDPS